MGRRTQRKAAVSPPDPINCSSHPVSAYFTRKTAKDTTALLPKEGPKMATGTTEAEMGEDIPGAVTVQDLKAVEMTIIEKISLILKPVQDQLANIKTSLAETYKTSECAMDLAMTVSEGSRTLQYEKEAFKQKLMAIDMETRALNIKIRGFPEKVESPLELQTFISNWMATTMSLEKGVAPALTRVRRLGAPQNPKRQRPRDVLVSFLCMRDKITTKLGLSE